MGSRSRRSSPAELIARLGLVEGDDISLLPNRSGAFEVAFAQRHERATDWMRPDPRDSFDPKTTFDLLDRELHDRSFTEDRS